MKLECKIADEIVAKEQNGFAKVAFLPFNGAMWKWLKIITLLLACGVAIYAVLSSEDALEAYQKRPMPPLALEGLDGKDISTAKWALETDGPKLINIFASWCAPCIAELPELEILNDHLPVYGLATSDKVKNLKPWLAKHGNPYKEIGLDKGLSLMWDLGISGVPTTLMLDASQRIVYVHEGAISKADIETQFLPRLKELKNE